MLYSFWEYRNKDLTAHSDGVPKFADSGAFSAWNAGANVTVEAYIDWLTKWQSRFTAYSNLDVIGDPAATWRNQELLQASGFRPLPVFHVGESFDWLTRYIDAGHTYIALGGMVPYLSHSASKLGSWLVRCFKVAGDTVRFHGFGATNWNLIRDFPFQSTDSTTWMAGARYGAQLIFAQGKLFQTRAHLLPQYATELRRLGFSVSDAIRATTGNAQLSSAIALASLSAAEDRIRRRHGKPFDIYLAGYAR